MNNVVYAGLAAVFVVFVRDVLHSSAEHYGILLAVGAIGGLAAGTVASRVVGLVGRPGAMVGGMAIQGLAFLGVAGAPNALVVGASYALVGFGLMQCNIVAVALRQSLVPAELRGRVLGVHRLFSLGTAPGGALVCGALADAYGLRTVFALGGAVLVAAAPLPFLTRLARVGAQPR